MAQMLFNNLASVLIGLLQHKVTIMTNTQRRRYESLKGKLEVAYNEWQANTDKSKNELLYTKWMKVNAQIDKLMDSVN